MPFNMRKMSKFAMKSEEKTLKKLKSCDINNRKFEFRKKGQVRI